MLRSQTKSACYFLLALSLALPSLYSARAQGALESQDLNTKNEIPVKEVTVFKDGHALVTRAGRLAINSYGEAIMDHLPSPLSGTFFPASLDPDQPLISVVAGRKKSVSESTALNIGDLLEANPEADVVITRIPGEKEGAEHARTLSGKLALSPVPQRSIEELDISQNLGAANGASAAVKGNLVQIQNENGVTFFPIDKIESVQFKNKPNPKIKNETLKNVLTLKVAKQANHNSANIGMMYVQSGLRWVPSYKIVLNGKGRARIKMQATLINDLIDLDDVSTHLVVGVPSFVAGNELDALAMAHDLTAVAGRMEADSFTRQAFSNAIMTQTTSNLDRDDKVSSRATPSADPGSKKEDLFVFNVKHVSLKRGERMVLPISEKEVDYEDLYTLELPIAPPPEVRRTSGYSAADTNPSAVQNDGQLRFMHKIRLKNNQNSPFTTAPALLEESYGASESLLAQSLMTYTPAGAQCDLDVTTAVDIKAAKHETETGRSEAATTWLNNKYARINLDGKIEVTNYGSKPAKVEINRRVLGQVDGNSAQGKMVMLNSLGELPGGAAPPWWNYYSWPDWWTQLNGVGKFTFQTNLQPGEKAEFTYNWHYFWR